MINPDIASKVFSNFLANGQIKSFVDEDNVMI